MQVPERTGRERMGYPALGVDLVPDTPETFQLISLATVACALGMEDVLLDALSGKAAPAPLATLLATARVDGDVAQVLAALRRSKWGKQQVDAFVARYRRTPYHAVYLPHLHQKRTTGEVPFLAQYFVPLDAVTGDTLTWYCHAPDL